MNQQSVSTDIISNSANKVKEKDKKGVAHKKTKYWDYFVKTVQIDNKVYDVLVDIRKNSDQNFVYSIRLWENKKIKK